MSSTDCNLVGTFTNLSTGATLTKTFDRVEHFVDRIETRMPHEDAALASTAEVDMGQFVFKNVRYDEFEIAQSQDEAIHIVLRQAGEDTGLALEAASVQFLGDNTYTISHTDPDLADSLVTINDNDDHVLDGQSFEYVIFYPNDVSLFAVESEEALSA